MSHKRKKLTTDETYHIFNRSIADEKIFPLNKQILGVLDLFNYYRYFQNKRYSWFLKLHQSIKKDYLDMITKRKPLVEIYSYCFMPNHYHFLLKQTENEGIVRFVSNFQNSYANYFNLVKKRLGGLFINSFKSKMITNEQTFVHVSRCIHLNPVTGYHLTLDELKTSYNTSLPMYLGRIRSEGCAINTTKLLNIFGSRHKYLEFLIDWVDCQRQLARIKKQLIE